MQDGVQENRTGNDEVTTTRIEPRNPQARRQIQGDEPLAKRMDLIRGDTMISKIIGARDDAAQAEDRAGGADHLVKAVRHQVVQILGHFPLDVLRQLALGRCGQRVGLHEAVGEPDDPDLEAARELSVVR